LCIAREEIEEMTTGFYKRLFTAQDHTHSSVVTRFVPTKVTPVMNDILATPFSA
jgi:hypothetical protein